MIKVGLGLLFVTVLAACNDKAETAVEAEASANEAAVVNTVTETAVYELEQPGLTIKMTIFGENDKVTKQITNSTIEYSAIGASDAEQAKTILDEVTNNTDYGAIQGITYKMEYGPTSAQESIEVDLTKADLKQLSELPGSAFEGNPEQGISFSATGTLLESSGFTKLSEETKD